jgi:hypothetical protein
MTTVFVAGKRALATVPQHVTRAVVRTRGNFTPPPGWQETPGAMHTGNGVWLVPVERATLEGEA